MSTPVFIIGDSFTATSEQEATLDGTPTVLGVYLFGSYGHSGGDGWYCWVAICVCSWRLVGCDDRSDCCRRRGTTVLAVPTGPAV
jgi:hypothetical protein